jgi:lysophospholipase L1-like esterase
MLRRLVTALPVAAAIALASGMLSAPTATAFTGPPNSMASMGDSITRAFNSCGWYADCVSRSWSTGDDTYVNSQRLRIRAINPNFFNAYNDAVSGSKAVNMASQASAAVSQHVQYVTIEIGANDACTSSESTMTSVSTYRSQIDSALNTLRTGLPDAKVFIASVPDIKRLWFIGKDNGNAQFFWSVGGICQSMLANPTSTAQADVDRRNRVQQRVIDYNTQLAQACAAYGANCKFDNNVVFNYPFVLSQVSGWDYFHPNRDGQRVLAEATYAATFTW